MSPLQRARHTPPLFGTWAVKIPLADVTGTVTTVLNAAPAAAAFWISTVCGVPLAAGRSWP